MTLIRHSKRSAKCRFCRQGRPAGDPNGIKLYWFHDTEGRQLGNVCETEDCSGTGDRNWTLYTEDGLRHYFVRSKGHCVNETSSGETVSVSTPEGTERISPSSHVPGWGTPSHNDDEPDPYASTVHHGPTIVDDDDAIDGSAVANKEELAHVLAESMRPALSLIKTLQDDVDNLRNELNANKRPTTVTVRNASTEEYNTVGTSHYALPEVLQWLDAGDNVWLTGPAGTGKTTIARQCAEALGRRFGAISLSPDTFVSAFEGFNNASGTYIPTLFRDFYENGGVFLADEVDNGNPSIMAKLNMGLENGQMAFPDGIVKKHPDFLCVAAANTYGNGPDRKYIGRNQLDAATLDRFTMIYIGVDESLETEMAFSQGASEDDVTTLLSLVRHLRIKADEYNMDLVFSPRASIKGARALSVGIPLATVIKRRVRKGITDQDWARLTRDWFGGDRDLIS